MKNPILFTLLVIICPAVVFSQNKTEDYQISLPDKKIPGSLYNSIEYLDSRYDTSNFGIVQLGAFNRKARVVPKVHLSSQVASVLQALNEDGAGNGKLLIHLRHFNFAEITGATKERGYCHIKVDLYANTLDRYTLLNKIDTVVVIKSLDVTRPMFRRGSELIVNLIASSLMMKPSAEKSFAYEEVLHMDDVEKKSLQVYLVNQFSDGLYKTYESFKQQQPDYPVKVEFKQDKIKAVSIVNADGTVEKAKAKDFYAVVQDGKAFVATEYGFYPLHKIENDLRFTGKSKVNANAGDVIAASVFFGLIGGLIASDANAMFDMKIDHSNGGFIRLREVRAE